jgi:DNA-directed RNA polymerase subunit E'/Rpb7
MPIKLVKRLTDIRKNQNGLMPYLRPDAKSQVTFEYDGQGNIVRCDTVVISQQHDPEVKQKKIREDIFENFEHVSTSEGSSQDAWGSNNTSSKVNEIGEGVIIPGDGAPYYDTTFELLTFKPELQEVVLGKIRDIADFGAFISLGPIEGMIHVSQTMDDFVSFSKDKVLIGKESKRSLNIRLGTIDLGLFYSLFLLWEKRWRGTLVASS